MKNNAYVKLIYALFLLNTLNQKMQLTGKRKRQNLVNDKLVRYLDWNS